MFKLFWNFLFPPLTKEERKIIRNLERLRKHGVKKSVSGRGALRTEFESEKAKKWYYKQIFKKVKDIKK